MNKIRKPIFICGCHRTGTTLLQTILSKHPNVDILPETKLFAWQWHPLKSISAANPNSKLAEISTLMPHVNRAWGLPENAHRMTGLLASKADAPFQNVAELMQHILKNCTKFGDGKRVGEKSPLHIYHVDALLKQFPDAKIIITTRDLRGAFYSQMSRSKRSKLSYRSFSMFNFVAAWTSAMELASLYQRRYGDQVVAIAPFEKLLNSPEQSLQKICQFIDVPFIDTMLDVSFENSSFEDVQTGVVSTAAERWRSGLQPEIKERLEFLASVQIEKWKYELGTPKPTLLDRFGKIAISFANISAKRWPAMFCHFGRDPRYNKLGKQYQTNSLPAEVRGLNHQQSDGSQNSPMVFVFGNHKSGTTAIASLLSEYCGLSKTIDFPRHCRPDSYELIRGNLNFDDIVSRYPELFNNQLVKIPALTFVANDVVSRFEGSRAVFIVRDPRDNIRSILNRRKIPGDRERLPLAQNWIWKLRGNPSFNPALWGLENETEKSYVAILAHRWNIAIHNLDLLGEEAIVVSYEKFLNDKQQTITDLAKNLDLAPTAEINERLDVQFQPAGNRNVSWLKFFGQKNLAAIERICDKGMRRFGYASKTDK